MDSFINYDEDLSENPFFQQLQNEHKIILDTAPLENWVICIPRIATLYEDHLTNPNFVLAHILIPNDELLGTHYTSLLGDDIVISNKILKTNNNHKCSILFEEIFYTKSLMKYKVWCIDCALLADVASHNRLETLDIFVIRDLNDAVDLIRNESNSMALFRRIENTCNLFVLANKKRMKRLPKLRTSIETLYSHCLHITMMNRRLKEKCRLDVHFYKIFKIAIETFMMNQIYGFVFDAITICRLEESEQFNKIIRNLSDSHLSNFKIDTKYTDILHCMRMELLKIEEFTTAIEKLGCLRRALNVATTNKTNTNLSIDEIIPILVFVIIKSSLTHWIATFTFIRDFIFTDIGNDVSEKGADSFLITTLEAAITYIKALNINNTEVCSNVTSNETNNHYLSDSIAIEQLQCIFETTDSFVEKLIQTIRFENEEETLRLLKTDTEVQILPQITNSSGQPVESRTVDMCHPLCDCEMCKLKSQAGRPNVNTQNSHGISAIHIAAMNGSTLMLNLILALEANVNLVDENNWSALHYAAAKGHQNTLLLLLHAGINVNAKTTDQYTALHLCSLNGHQGCVKALLYYADHMNVYIAINNGNKMGDTPLHLASKWGFTEVVETLLETGGNVECMNRAGHTALHYAHNSIISNLLQNSFVVIEKTQTNNEISVAGENVETFRGFIRDDLVGARTSKLNKRKSSIDKIIAAIRNGDINLAYHFLGVDSIPINESDHHPLCNCEYCAPLYQQSSSSSSSTSNGSNSAQTSTFPLVDINEENFEGFTVLHAAVQIGNVSLMEFLCQKHKASLHIKTHNLYKTVLHVAVEEQHVHAAEFILNETGDDLINAQDSMGNTALHVAVEKGNGKLVDLLMKYDPNIELTNNQQYTALDIAKHRMYFNIIQSLNPKFPCNSYNNK